MKQHALKVAATAARKIGVLSLAHDVAEAWQLRREGNARPCFPFIKRKAHRSFQILTYHRVNDAGELFFTGLPTALFARQMEMLHHFFCVLPLEELVTLNTKGELPPRAIAITFDDGYRDNYENAFPILKQLQLPATIFLTTGPLESDGILWHDRVFFAFQQTRCEEVLILGKTYSLETVAEKELAQKMLRRHLRKCPPAERDEIVQEVTVALGVPQVCQKRVQKLSWQDIEEMAAHNISFGAHTVTHPVLSQMALADAEKEILLSKETIERKLRRTVQLFAYPNGTRADFTEPVKKIVREIGFRAAVTTIPGTNDALSDCFELRRELDTGCDPDVLACKLGWAKFAG
jgi:peptidoglycan/xylan/chitin deacetylase (PgdA/CDA1 family)